MVLAAEGREMAAWKEGHRIFWGGKYRMAMKKNFFVAKKDCSNPFSHMVSHYSTLWVSYRLNYS